MKRCYPTFCLLLAALSAGCRHKPVYPEVGSAYITSIPTGAEVLVNDVSTHQRTPIKIDGIKTGTNTISIRYYGYKVWIQQFNIKPGETKRIDVEMDPITPYLVGTVSTIYYGTDMAMDQVTGKLYVSNLANDQLSVFQTSGPAVTGPTFIPVGARQLFVAVSSQAGKIWTITYGDSVVSIDLAGGTILGKIPPGQSRGYTSLAFSPDGRMAAVVCTDSSVVVFDVGGDSILTSFRLAAPPFDAIFDRTGDNLYVSIGSLQRVVIWNIPNRQIAAEIPTGHNPDRLFLDAAGQRLGVCNVDDRTVQIAAVSNWAFTTSPQLQGMVTPDACFASDQVHLWALETNLGGDPAPPPSKICLIYLPLWQPVAHYTLGYMPRRINSSADGKYLYILQQFSRDIAIFRTDTE